MSDNTKVIPVSKSEEPLEFEQTTRLVFHEPIPNCDAADLRRAADKLDSCYAHPGTEDNTVNVSTATRLRWLAAWLETGRVDKGVDLADKSLERLRFVPAAAKRLGTE